MTFFAILVALYGHPTAETSAAQRSFIEPSVSDSELSIAREQAARVADTYQPQAPTVRIAARVRCVTTLNGKGEIESHRCGL